MTESHFCAAYKTKSTKQTNTLTDNRVVAARAGGAGRMERANGVTYMETEGAQTVGGEHTMQSTDVAS